MVAEPARFSAAVGDSYESLVKLFEMPRRATRILEGELQFQTSGVTYILVPRGTPAPLDATVGIKAALDSSRTFGPNSPYNLDEIWVKETTAGGGAVAVFVGYLE